MPKKIKITKIIISEYKDLAWCSGSFRLKLSLYKVSQLDVEYF